MASNRTHAAEMRSKSDRSKHANPIVYLVGIIIVAAIASPVIYVVLGGFRSNAQLNNDPAGLPNPWKLQNYISIFSSTNSPFWREAKNSIVISVGATLLIVVLSVMTAFILARYTFKGRGALYATYAAGLMFPITVAALPIYLMMGQLHLTGTPWAVILPQVGFGMPMSVVILVPFLRAIPAELEEAATIDGASRIGFFWRVMLPLSGPGLITVGVLAFINSWNGYLLPMLTLTKVQQYTLPLGVAHYASEHNTDTAAILAYTSICMLPALILFTMFQRRIVGGLTGAVKG